MGTRGIHLDRSDGEHNRRAKLTEKIVRHLRASFARKPPEMGLMEFCRGWAAMFGVSPVTVQRVVRNKKWRVSPPTVRDVRRPDNEREDMKADAYPAGRIIPVGPVGKKRSFDYFVAAERYGWRWIRFNATPIHGTPGYPGPMPVRQFVSPKTLKNKRWKAYFERIGGYADADGSEPLAYCYCSSIGPEFVPESTAKEYPKEWKMFTEIWKEVESRATATSSGNGE